MRGLNVVSVVVAVCGFLVASAGCSSGGKEETRSDDGIATATGSVATASAPVTSASADVVTQASESWAATSAEKPPPSALGDGSVDGAALRKLHVARLKSDTSPVTVLRGESALDLGKRICEATVPKREPATKILVKPNLCGIESIKENDADDNGIAGRTTDPEFVRGVIQCLKARGHRDITVADGCGHSHKFVVDLTRVSGYTAMTKEEGVDLIALDDDGVFDVENGGPAKPLPIKGIAKSHVPTLLMPRILAEVLDRGMLIAIPKLKAHRFSVVSLAIKGMQGNVMYSDAFPAYKQKWRSHVELQEYLKKRKAGEEDRKLYERTLQIFAERMVDVLEIATPDVVLLEGAPAMGGDGFGTRTPSAEKVAIGGTNPVSVDKVGAEFLGLWNNERLAVELFGHRTSPLIEVAAQRFGLDLDKVAIVGDGKSLFEKARPAHLKAMAKFVIDTKPKADEPAWSPKPTPKFAPLAPSWPGVSSGASPAGGTPAPSTGGARPELHAVLVDDAAITIDGKADEAVWQKAPVARFSTNYAGKETGIPTSARFLWSKGALYAHFDLEKTGLFTDRERPTDVERKALYQEDCVEIFLGPDADVPSRYFEIELGPFGHFFDLAIDKEKNKSDTAWSAGLTIKTTQDAANQRASIEVAIRAKSVVDALVAGKKLPLNLYRMEGKTDRAYLAWSPPRTEKPNFHVPEAFGRLVLDP